MLMTLNTSIRTVGVWTFSPLARVHMIQGVLAQRHTRFYLERAFDTNYKPQAVLDSRASFTAAKNMKSGSILRRVRRLPPANKQRTL
jgi:hypothetical protein